MPIATANSSYPSSYSTNKGKNIYKNSTFKEAQINMPKRPLKRFPKDYRTSIRSKEKEIVGPR
jgi:hypothetical protein